MMNKPNLLIIIILSLLIGACGNTAEDDGTSIPVTSNVVVNDTFPLNPLFSDFYEYLGGMEILVPAITP